MPKPTRGYASPQRNISGPISPVAGCTRRSRPGSARNRWRAWPASHWFPPGRQGVLLLFDISSAALPSSFGAPFARPTQVYTRNLWVAWMSILFGQRVVFDHYRPWPDQIPPLQYWLYRLFCHERFLGSICHSHYTTLKYEALGVLREKLRSIHNGFEPQRFQAPIPLAEAKQSIGLPRDARTVVYPGRINHKRAWTS
jgi:glycosyltransferase involved in cell wall biosynthesis